MLSRAALVGLLGLGIGGCGSEVVEPPAEFLVQPVLESEARTRELAATTDELGQTWLAFLELPASSHSKAAELKLLLTSAADPTRPLALVSIATGTELGPVTLAPLAGGGVFLVWEDGGLFGRSATASPRPDELDLGPVVIVPTGAGPTRLPDAAALTSGGIGLTWQALDGHSWRAYFAHRNDGGDWSAPQLVSQADPDGASDVWRPRLAAGADGRIQIAYDRFEHGATGGFDVWLATSQRPGASFTQRLVAGGPTYQGLPEVGIDGQGRTWISYEEAPSFGQGGSLRSRRQTRLAAVTKDGALQHAILPRQLATAQRGDLPRLLVTPRGLALTRRLPQNIYQPRNAARSVFYATWHTFVLGFDAYGEGHDLELDTTDGDNENDAALLFGPNGFGLYYTSDDRSATFAARYSFEVPIENPWRLAHAALPLPIGFPALESGPPPPLLQAWSTPLPQGRALCDRNPRALFGDLHRHTDLSRCAGRRDGTFLDAVRYARGPGALDFLAVTDHFQHLTPASFWRELRDVERWNAPGSLVILPGLERMIFAGGHQNLIFDSRASALEAGRDAPPKRLARSSVVAIPHMSSMARNPFDWQRFDADVQRLVEVHQGRRGSYEGLPIGLATDDQAAGEAIWPMAALDAGNEDGWLTHLAQNLDPEATPPGLISSSDHSSSGAGFAGISLAPGAPRELSRAAIFAALHDRRSFAASGPEGAPHALTVELVDGNLRIETDRSQLVSVTILENGLQLAVLDGQARAHSVVEQRLVLRAHFGLSSARTFTIRSKHVKLDSRGFGQPRPELNDPASLGNHLQLDLAADQAAELDLLVALTPTQAEPADLHLELAPVDAKSPPLALDLDLRELAASPSRRFWLATKGHRPYLDIELLPPALPPGTGPIDYPLEGRPTGAIYYVRAAFTDGHHAWSRLLRD